MKNVGRKMNKYIREVTLIRVWVCFLIFPNASFGQHQIKGIVMSKDGFPLPGVTIMEKETNAGTVTNLDGEFNFNASNGNVVLRIFSVGFEPQEIAINGRENIHVTLKENCIRCFFDGREIGLYVSSGVLKTPVGSHFQVEVPTPFRQIVVAGNVGYQTNFERNSYLHVEVELLHLVVSCEYDVNVGVNYRDINWNSTSTFESFSIEGNLNLSRVRIFPHFTIILVGFGKSDTKFQEDVESHRRVSGYSIGLGTYIGKPLWIEVKGKTAYWENFWEYKGEVKREFKRVNMSAEYLRINSFSELSFKVGIKLNY